MMPCPVNCSQMVCFLTLNLNIHVFKCFQFTISQFSLLSRVGNFEVGVHIADVSYFMEEGNALDQMASRRATSVYLIQKVKGLFFYLKMGESGKSTKQLILSW